jgi:ABC-type spermidine/putrescine transport system permease subunit II
MNRLITTLVQLMLWAPIVFAITLAVNESKKLNK